MWKVASAVWLLVFALPASVYAAGTPAVHMPSDAPDDIQLAVRLLQSPEPEERAQAADWIRRYGDQAKPAIPYLIKFLAEPISWSALAPPPYGPTSLSLAAEQSLRWIGKAAAPALIAAFTDPNPQVVRRAVQILGQMYLAEPPENPDWAARWTAITVLGEMKCKAAVGPLLNTLSVADDRLRVSVMLALVRIGTDEAIEGVVSNLGSSDAYTRRQVVRELGNLRERRATETLVGLLDQKDDEIVSNAIYALERIGDKRAISPLRELIQGMPLFVSSYAVRALVRLGDRAACETVIRALRSSNPSMDVSVAIAASEASDPGLIDAALSAIKEKRNINLAVAALRKGKSGDPRIVPVMIGLMDSDLNAMAYLGDCGEPAAIDALISAVKNGKQGGAARYAIAMTGSRRAAEALVDALPQADASRRSDMPYALGRMGFKPGADEGLIAALADEIPANRWYAAQLLGEVKTEASVAALITALRDKNPGVRSVAAESLGALGTSRAADALIAELMDPNSCIRPDAVRALAVIGGRPVKPYLKAALTDNSQAVRRQASLALEPGRPPLSKRYIRPDYTASLFWGSAIGPEKDLRPAAELLIALADPDPAARSRAIATLQSRKEKKAVEPLIKVVQTDSSADVRRAAVYALKAIWNQRAAEAMTALIKAPLPPAKAEPVVSADQALLTAVIGLLDRNDLSDSPRSALKSMTGQDLGSDPAKWREWVAGHIPTD